MRPPKQKPTVKIDVAARRARRCATHAATSAWTPVGRRLLDVRHVLEVVVALLRPGRAPEVVERDRGIPALGEPQRELLVEAVQPADVGEDHDADAAPAPRATRRTRRSGSRRPPRARGRRARPPRPRSRGSAARSRGRSTCPRPYNAATRRSRSSSFVHQPTEARTSPRPGEIAHDDAGLGEPRDDVRRLLDRDTPRDERRALSGTTTSGPPRRDAPGSARPSRPPARTPTAGIAAIAARSPAVAAPGMRFGSNRAAPVLRLERSVLLVALLREVARASDAERVGLGDDERARPLRAAEPLLPRDRVEVEPARVDGDRADGLRPVDEDRQPGLSRGARGPAAPHRSSRGRGRARAGACAA